MILVKWKWGVLLLVVFIGCLTVLLIYRRPATTTLSLQHIADHLAEETLRIGEKEPEQTSQRAAIVESLRSNALCRITEATTSFTDILGEGAKDYRSCVAALRKLPSNLTVQQIENLRLLVAVGYSPLTGMSQLEFNAIKNDAASLLLVQKDFPADLLADFAVQYEDSSQDEVWRDYCVQMLVTGFMNLERRLNDDPVAPVARELALEVLMAAASDAEGVAQGTALLGLNTILDSEPGAFSREERDLYILSVLSDPFSDKSAQLTAIRLAGLSRLESARPALEQLAASSSGLLRNAAVRSLNELDSELDSAETQAESE